MLHAFNKDLKMADLHFTAKHSLQKKYTHKAHDLISRNDFIVK